jgi:uncharacterized damage-inducible protein DinB
MTTDMAEATRWFLSSSRNYLMAEYLPKIEKCLEQIDESDLWWKPNEETNSIGNLILHLCGNVRQWIISGVGGEIDGRDRQSEFDKKGGVSSRELLDRLTATLREADAVLGSLRPDDWDSRRTIQGNDVSIFEAIYHVVEHFSMHAGQIAYVTKLRAGRDLEFYDVKDGIARPKWGQPR